VIRDRTLRRREKIDTVSTASTNRPRPLGSRNRPCKTTRRSASGVERPRNTRISRTFEPRRFAWGTSGARTSSGFTGGVALVAASFDVPSTVASGAPEPIARTGAFRIGRETILGSWPRTTTRSRPVSAR
jgi:hypothetical protein